MSEQWHDVTIFVDDDAELIEIDHDHPEPANDCDLSLYLTRTDGDELFSLAPGYYRLRMEDGELVVRVRDDVMVVTVP